MSFSQGTIIFLVSAKPGTICGVPPTLLFLLLSLPIMPLRADQLENALGLRWPGTTQLMPVSGFSLLLGASGQENTLTIVADGVSNTNGVVGVLIFNSSRGWPNDNARAFRAVAVRAKRGSVSIPVTALPSGRYAVVVLHDENQNRRLDRTWFGLPKEQWGISNNPRVRFSPPSFKQAAFMVTHDEEIHVILH